MGTDRGVLCFELHFGSDLVDGDVLPRLQAVLGRISPKLTATLEVSAYDRDPDRRHVDAADPDALRAAVLERGSSVGPTYKALTKQHGRWPTTRRTGSVNVRGRGPGATGYRLGVYFDNLVPARPIGRSWIWSNSIQGDISATGVEGSPRQEWVLALADELATATTMLWGAAYHKDEFANSNLDTSKGIRAIGRDIRTALPGVYWLNIFGPPYIDLVGRGRLMSAPAAVCAVGRHIFIRSYADADDWASQTDARRALTTALGAEHFFDRHNPDRVHRAPNFGLDELPDKPPYRVYTDDGETFTPLQ